MEALVGEVVVLLSGGGAVLGNRWLFCGALFHVFHCTSFCRGLRLYHCLQANFITAVQTLFAGDDCQCVLGGFWRILKMGEDFIGTPIYYEVKILFSDS